MREIDQEVRRIIDEAIEKVRHILDLRRPSLEALTKKLMDVESIDAEELKRIVEENSPGPRVVPGTEVPLRLAPPEAVDNAAATGMEKSG
jgi:cell division protease FtsH